MKLKTCASCPNRFLRRKGNRIYCDECRAKNARFVNLKCRERQRASAKAASGSYPPLENGHPTLSLGWFKTNLANGHTAQSLADLTGVDIGRIKLEMSFVRDRKKMIENCPYPYVMTHNVRQMPAKSRFKNPNLDMLKGGA